MTASGGRLHSLKRYLFSLCAGLGPGAGGGNGSLLHVHDDFAALSCVLVPSGAGVRPSDPCGLHFLPARPPFILRPPDVHARGSNPPFGIPASSNLVNVVEHNLITHFSSRLTGMWGGTAPHSLHLCGSLSWPGFLSVVPTLSPRPVAPTFDDLPGAWLHFFMVLPLSPVMMPLQSGRFPPFFPAAWRPLCRGEVSSILFALKISLSAFSWAASFSGSCGYFFAHGVGLSPRSPWCRALR